MSCLPYFSEHLYARPLFCTRPWFQGDCSFYEGAAYSVVPLYFYPRSYFSTPEFQYSPISREPLNTFVVASSFSPVTFNHGQRDSNYWRYATAAMNASAIQALENPKTICNPQGDRALVKSTEISSSEKSRIDEVVLKLLASTDHSASNTMEQRLSCAENIACKSKMLNVNRESEHAENIEINKISRGLQVGTSCSISNMSQSCYLSASELNFPNENFSIFSSSLDGDLEVSYKKQQKMSVTLEDTNKTDVVNQVCTHLKDNQNDENRCIDVDDDSQQDYHSAEEQDYMEQCFSSKKVHDNSDFSQVKELANEIGCAEGLFACSSVVDSFSEIPEGSEIPESSQVYKCDQHCAKDSCLHLGDHKREQSVSMFYSIHNEDLFRAEAGERNDSKSFLTCLTGIEEKVKKASFSDVSSVNTGLCKKADHSIINALQKSLQVLSPGRTDSPYSFISTEGTEVTDFCVHDQSIGSIVAAKKDKCTPYLNKIASKNKVNQAVDASSDFRACFTTSRATNVKASVVSRSQNTMITMMNKYRPEEWLSIPHRSVACNTDWSAMNSNVEVTATPEAAADALETVGCSTARNGKKSKLEDCVELNSRGSDEIPNRMVPLSQTTSYLPCCCKELLQRAINAEMQLLNINSQKDDQHSWKICKSDLEEKEYVSSPALEIRPQQESSQDADTPSLPVVIQNMSGDENSAPQPSPSSKEEKNDLVESSSLNTQEVNEDWFDAKENLTAIESSINPAGNESKKDQLFSRAEKQIVAEETKKESGETKKESKNFYCVHVAGLSPSVSEVDLWLRFQKYQVSKVSICEYSSNYRYATLGFKAASDAKLAVKEMNEQEIKGKAVKVQLVKSLRESTASNNQNLAKQDIESQRPHYSPESIENKNCNGILKVPPVSVTPKSQSHVSDSTSPSKGPEPSKGSLKSLLNPVSDFPNVTKPASGSSEKPLFPLASPVNPSPDIKPSKTSPRNALLETDKEDITENFMPQGSVKSSSHLSTTFIPANALNLRSFRKVLKKLEELHPETNRDKILDALVEIKENKGSLSGLPLSSIVQMTSSLLKKKYESKLEEKPVTGTHLRNK